MHTAFKGAENIDILNKPWKQQSLITASSMDPIVSFQLLALLTVYYVSLLEDLACFAGTLYQGTKDLDTEDN